MAGTGTRPDSASWLRNITHGSEENNDTAGRNARFGGSTSPFNRGSMRSLQGASNASRGTRRQTYSDSRSPSSARFAYSPSAVPPGAAVIRPIWRPPGGTNRATWGQHSRLGALATTRMAQSGRSKEAATIKTKLIGCAVRCTMCTLQFPPARLYDVRCTLYNSHRLDCTMYNVQCAMYNVHCTMTTRLVLVDA